MAVEYVPTTREMESAYVCDSLGAGVDEAEARRRFSRWLTARDAEIREQIAREIDTKAAKCHKEGGGPCGSLWRRGMTEAAAIARGAK